MSEFLVPAMLWAGAAIVWMAGQEVERRWGLAATPLYVVALVLAAWGVVIGAKLFWTWWRLQDATAMAAERRAYAAGRAQLYLMQMELAREVGTVLRAARNADEASIGLVMGLFSPPHRMVRVGGPQGQPGIVTVAGYRHDRTGVQLSARMVLDVVLNGADDWHVAPKRFFSDGRERTEYDLAVDYLVNRGYVQGPSTGNEAPRVMAGWNRQAVAECVAAELHVELGGVTA